MDFWKMSRAFLVRVRPEDLLYDPEWLSRPKTNEEVDAEMEGELQRLGFKKRETPDA